VSDSILRIHATDPDFQADDAAATRARDAADSLFPGADQIDIEIYPRVTLIDCGETSNESSVRAAARRSLTSGGLNVSMSLPTAKDGN
jgi:hypothetical protein